MLFKIINSLNKMIIHVETQTSHYLIKIFSMKSSVKIFHLQYIVLGRILTKMQKMRK